ncbi:helix-turn-helix domain-containing protein [Amycolatopsis sp. NPDC051373]|uniref:TetR/AcrR family transcriptional regulator n=1 Tax=Amycolatopsis sp. NPDC051373 TaxID=3155801 RepID=UPI003450708F
MSRPLRADAAANLEKILDAAEAVFDEHGPAVSIELVAKRAGVGLGTVYRRFADKQALLSALVERLLVQAVEVADRHAGTPDGLVTYLFEVGALLARHSGSVARMWSDEQVADLVERSRTAQAALVAQARQHGVVRADLTPEDVAVALWSLGGVLDITRGTTVDAWRRHLELVVAGWTNTAAHLGHPPLTDAQMREVIRHSPSAAQR